LQRHTLWYQKRLNYDVLDKRKIFHGELYLILKVMVFIVFLVGSALFGFLLIIINIGLIIRLV